MINRQNVYLLISNNDYKIVLTTHVIISRFLIEYFTFGLRVGGTAERVKTQFCSKKLGVKAIGFKRKESDDVHDLMLFFIFQHTFYRGY